MADLVTVTSGANSTLPANTVIATRQMTGGEHVQSVLGGPEGITTTEFTFAAADGAQTNAGLVTVSAGTQIVVTMAQVMVDEATTVGVAVRLGMATATLPTAATTGAAGIFLAHPGITPGSGIVVGNGSGVIAEGATGEDVRLTSEAPTGGAFRVIITYFTKPVS